MRWNRKIAPSRSSNADLTSPLARQPSETRFEFHAEVERVLRAAGWSPGRCVDVSLWRNSFEPAGLYMHDAAERFLSEFGGVIVRVSGSGVTAARSPFEIDPMICLEEEDLFKHWSLAIDGNIYPIGDVENGHHYLGIDEREIIYIVSNFLSDMGAIPNALEKLVLGYKAESTRY